MNHERNCSLCLRANSPDPPPGGWVYEDPYWLGSVFPEYEVPGWIVLQARRHVESLMAMTESEAASLGCAFRIVSRVLSELLEPSHVYVLAFGERFPHWHGLLIPRDPAWDSGNAGINVLNRRESLRDPDRALSVADAVRKRISLLMSTPEN